MTLHPCTFPHILGYAKPETQPETIQLEPEARSPGDWTDEEIEEFAGKTFEPWDRNNCPLPSNKEWIDGINPYLVSLRIAFAINCMTKDELVEAVAKMDPAAEDSLFNETLDRASTVEKLMRGYAELASAATARLMCAATVLALREEGKLCA